jgi:hypothetical protein
MPMVEKIINLNMHTSENSVINIFKKTIKDLVNQCSLVLKNLI